MKKKIIWTLIVGPLAEQSLPSTVVPELDN